MHFPGSWVGVDIISTRLRGDIFIHSVNGLRLARPLRREGMSLGFDAASEQLFRDLVNTTLNSTDYEDRATRQGNIEYRTHWVVAPDGVAVGLIVWLGPGPVPPHPSYNSWFMDVENVTTTSAGDDLQAIGDGRAPGETRPIRDLLRFINPDDVQAFLSLYYDVATGDRGTLAEAYWSVKPPGATGWTHFWSSAPVVESGTRIVHGLTVKLADRKIEQQTVATMVQYSQGTVVMVDPGTRVTVTVAGRLAPDLDDARLRQLLDQIDLDIIAQDIDKVVEQTVIVGGAVLQAAAFSMPSTQKRPVRPVAILLVRQDKGDGAAA